MRIRAADLTKPICEKEPSGSGLYKAFAVTDAKDGYVEKISVTPANVSECRYFPEAVSGIRTKRMYGDNGYASAENLEFLRKNGVKSAIMHMAYKNKPLGHWQSETAA